MSYLHVCSLLLGRHHVVTLVFLDRAQHADAHLVGAAVQLQPLLMLRADLPVQVPDLVHQLVPLEGGVLVVGLQVLVAIGRQAHEAGLDGLQLAADADVAAHVPGAGVVVIRGRRRRGRGLGGPVAGGGMARGGAGGRVAARRGPLVVRDSALRAHVGARVVGMVPVGLQADGAEGVPTGDGHGVPQVLLAQIADALVIRHF